MDITLQGITRYLGDVNISTFSNGLAKKNIFSNKNWANIATHRRARKSLNTGGNMFIAQASVTLDSSCIVLKF
jgi:hypothetical protein